MNCPSCDLSNITTQMVETEIALPAGCTFFECPEDNGHWEVKLAHTEPSIDCLACAREYVWDTCETDENFWDCECEVGFIHEKTRQAGCPDCHTHMDEQPDSRVLELKHYGYIN